MSLIYPFSVSPPPGQPILPKYTCSTALLSLTTTTYPHRSQKQLTVGPKTSSDVFFACCCCAAKHYNVRLMVKAWIDY